LAGLRSFSFLGWKPIHILDINASPVSATLKTAGLDISKDIISGAFSPRRQLVSGALLAGKFFPHGMVKIAEMPVSQALVNPSPHHH
jgi:hypothetical protein